MATPEQRNMKMHLFVSESPTYNQAEHDETENVGIITPRLLKIPRLFVVWVYCQAGFRIRNLYK